ncbi:MAG: hypothetical protein HXX20_02135 [Chloroflexi bacterium]|nr:hypothetical protein [Chloroflexota bacterium]
MQVATQQTPPQIPVALFNYVLQTTNSSEAATAYLNLILSVFFATGQWPVFATTPLEQQQQPHTAPTPSELRGGRAEPLPANPDFIYQPPLPKMTGYLPLAPEPDGKRKKQCGTGYDYTTSPYFAEATRLIAEHAIREVSFQGKLVLSVILAWCSFPLFKEMGGRRGEWMTLSAVRLAKEAHMHVSRLKECVADLQGAGLISVASQLMPFEERGKSGDDQSKPASVSSDSVPAESLEKDMDKLDFRVISKEEFDRLKFGTADLAKLGENHFFKGRFAQDKNWIYRLKYKLGDSIPIFNPFNTQNHSESLGNTQQQVILPSATSQNHLEILSSTEIQSESLGNAEKGSESLVGAIPSDSEGFGGVTCIDDHDVNDVNDGAAILSFETPKETIKGDLDQSPPSASVTTRLDKKIGRLNAEQLAKFDFLTKIASFDGQCLDPAGAIGLAVVGRLTLDEMQQRYEQVKVRAAAGDIESPLGYLRFAITHRKDVSHASDDDAHFNRFVTENEQRVALEEGSSISNGKTSTQQPRRERGQRRSPVAKNGKTSPISYQSPKRYYDRGNGWLRDKDTGKTFERSTRPDITDDEVEA